MTVVKMYQTGSKCTCWETIFARLNYIIPCIAGLLFFSGWWLIIDAHAMHRYIFDTNRAYHLPGTFATMFLICVNSLPSGLLYNSYYYATGTCCTPLVARTALFLFFMGSFGCVTSSLYILINDFILDQSKYQWPGYAICIQNVFILTSNLLLRFVKRSEDMW